MPDENDLIPIRKRALRILGSRNMSSQEMFKRLTGKGENPDDAQDTVDWLVELGYINDEDYATLIVRHYSAKGYGLKRVRNELFRRGIPRDLWEDKLGELDDTEMEDAAIAFLRKKLGGGSDKDDLRRVTDALVRRGYGYDDAKAAVNRYLESLES